MLFHGEGCIFKHSFFSFLVCRVVEFLDEGLNDIAVYFTESNFTESHLRFKKIV